MTAQGALTAVLDLLVSHGPFQNWMEVWIFPRKGQQLTGSVWTPQAAGVGGLSRAWHGHAGLEAWTGCSLKNCSPRKR